MKCSKIWKQRQDKLQEDDVLLNRLHGIVPQGRIRVGQDLWWKSVFQGKGERSSRKERENSVKGKDFGERIQVQKSKKAEYV